MSHSRFLCLYGLAALLGAVGAAQAAILHVPADFRTIQAAVDAAQTGDQILVAAGEYRENVKLAKTVVLVSESGAKRTVIDGQQKGPVVTIDETADGFPVRVTGFTLRHGYGGDGGGVAQLGGSMIIEDNQIVENQVNGFLACSGGGIYVSGSATIRHNLIARNSAGCAGGGIYIDSGWPTPPLVEDNVIQNNNAGNSFSGGHGGGMYVSAQAVIQRNVIRQNTAYGYHESDTQVGGEAGGLMVWPRAGDPVEVADNAILGNDSVFDGGGVVAVAEDSYSKRVLFVNNTIVGNTSPSFSQLVTYRYGSRVSFANNVIASMDGSVAISCNSELDGVSPVFVNNDVYAGNATPAYGSCAHQADSGTNLTVDPMFAAHAHNALCQLAAGSPLIDAGSNAYARKQPEDLLGNPRIVDGGQGSVIDIGACEYSQQ